MPRGRPRNPIWSSTDLAKLFQKYGSVKAVSSATGLSESAIRKKAQRTGVDLPGTSGHRLVSEKRILTALRLSDRTWYLEPNSRMTLERHWLSQVAKQNAVLCGVNQLSLKKRIVRMGEKGVIQIVDEHPINSVDADDVYSDLTWHFGSRAVVSHSAIMDLIPDPAGTVEAWREAIPEFASQMQIEAFACFRDTLHDEVATIYRHAMQEVDTYLLSEFDATGFRNDPKVRVFDQSLTIWGRSVQKGLQSWRGKQVAQLHLTSLSQLDESGIVIPSPSFQSNMSGFGERQYSEDALAALWEWVEKVASET